MPERFTKNTNKNKEITLKNTIEGITGTQLVLDIGLEAYKEYDGFEVGVLSDGTPFFTQRGLGEFVGVANSHIGELSTEWEKERFSTKKDRLLFIKKYLDEKGYTGDRLYIKIKRNGRFLFAYPDIVCMAVLEYYAFEAKKVNEIALQRFRVLAQKSLRDLMYDLADYHPEKKNVNAWRHFYDRVSINKNSVPSGYFSVFREAAGLIVDLLDADYPLSDKTVPDLSVGLHWSKYYKENLMDEFGEPKEYDHNYPEYFAQAASNPQKAKAYPIDCLGKFKTWLENEYIFKHFPKYMKNKIEQLNLDKKKANVLLNLYTNKQIEKK